MLERTAVKYSLDAAVVDRQNSLGQETPSLRSLS